VPNPHAHNIIISLYSFTDLVCVIYPVLFKFIHFDCYRYRIGASEALTKARPLLGSNTIDIGTGL
jgi:hypothetical protein